MKTMSMVLAICLVGSLLAIGAFWRSERVRCAYRIRTLSDELSHAKNENEWLRGDIEKRGSVGPPSPLGLHAPKQEQPRMALGRLPGPERTPRPANDALPLGGQAHDRPDLGKIEEVLRVDRGKRRGRELADQIAHRTCHGLPSIDPAPKRHYHRG